MRQLFLLLLLSLALNPAQSAEKASPVEQLQSFIASMETMEGRFDQHLQAANRELLERRSGRFKLAKPNLLRWIYQKPDSIKIISDGSKLWIEDKALQQVIVKNLGSAIENSPAFILTSDGDLAERYILSAIEVNGRPMARLQPRGEGGEFLEIRFAFSGVLPESITMIDLFEQQTEIRFRRLKLNKPHDRNDFFYAPPEGMDIYNQE